MAVAVTNTIANGGSAWTGQAEQFADVIYDISPQDTPYLTLAKKVSVNARVYQWQEDALN